MAQTTQQQQPQPRKRSRWRTRWPLRHVDGSRFSFAEEFDLAVKQRRFLVKQSARRRRQMS